MNGVPYEVDEGVNGYLVPFGDKKALKEKILYLLDNTKVAKKMGKVNEEKVKGYTWDAIAEETLEVYKSQM